MTIDKIERDKKELDQFKNEINIVDYALVVGYKIDQKASSANHVILRSSGGEEKISVKRGMPSMYFNYHNDSDKGTIIDFVKKETKNFGEIRKKLRAFLGGGQIQEHKNFIPYVKDKSGAEQRKKYFDKVYKKMNKELVDAKYLNSRGIDKATLYSKAFINKIHNHQTTDKETGELYCNTIFPLENASGVVTAEKKNEKCGKLFSQKEDALWISNPSLGGDKVTNLILSEHPIDSMSHYQLFHTGKSNNLYVATAGGFSDQIKETLEYFIKKYDVQNFVIAVDNDLPGEKYIRRLLDMVKVPGDVYVHKPVENDFNLDLKNKHVSREFVNSKEYEKKNLNKSYSLTI